MPQAEAALSAGAGRSQASCRRPGPLPAGTASPRRIIALHPPRERAVRFTRENTDAHLVAAWQRGGVRVGEEWLRAPFIVSADRIVRDWTPPAPEELGPADLEPVLPAEPDIVILGTGGSLLRPHLDLMAIMAGRGIGLEIMSTPAACRTYNVLLHERRAVAAALYIP